MDFKKTLNRLFDSHIRTLFTNSSWLLGSEIFIYAVALLQGIVIARYLGAKNYGTLSVVITYVTLVNQVLDFRIFEAATKYISEFRARNEPKKLMATVKLCYLVDALTGIAAFIAVIFSAEVASGRILHNPTVYGMIMLYAVRLLFMTVDGTSSAILTVFNRFSWMSLYSGLTSLLQLLLTALLLHLNYGIIGVLASYIIISSFGSIIILFLVFRLLHQEGLLSHIRTRISGISDRWKEMRSFMLSTNLNEFFTLFTKNIDILLLGYYRNPVEVGYYRLAKSFVSTISVVGSPFYRAFFPQLSKMWNDNNIPAFKSMIRKYTLIMTLLVIPASIAVIFAAPWLIRITVGGQFLPSATPIRIMIWGVALATILSWTRPAILSMGRPGILTASNGIMAATLLLLSVLCIPRWGYLASTVLFLYPFAGGHLIAVLAYMKFINLSGRQPYVQPANEAPVP